MNKLTFLLPLKDRPHYTKIWLDHNLRPEYDYLVADGSIGTENEALFKDLRLPNLTYLRFQKDLSIECYVQKMLEAASRVKTKYVMTCDNDDFINFVGVNNCIAALEDARDAACAGGRMYGVMQSEFPVFGLRYSLPMRNTDPSALNGRAGFDGLKALFSNYIPLWYQVFRTEKYRAIWQDIKLLQISNVFLVEMLQAQLALCHGKNLQLKTNHYVRLMNPRTSAARESSISDGPHTSKIYFDDAYRQQVLKMSGHVAGLAGVELPLLLSELKNYYLSCVPRKSSICSRMTNLATRIRSVFARKVAAVFSIAFGIRWINFRCRIS
jgi:glycosyltransferase domain-containing protein